MFQTTNQSFIYIGEFFSSPNSSSNTGLDRSHLGRAASSFFTSNPNALRAACRKSSVGQGNPAPIHGMGKKAKENNGM
jgi:hypothetical protein